MAAPESGLDDCYVISSSIDCEMDVFGGGDGCFDEGEP